MPGDFTFIHAADVHLDSAVSGLSHESDDYSRLARGATRRAFAAVIDLAIAERAAFVVIAGDLYDGTWKDQSTGQFAAAQLARLCRAGIRSFIVFGNHDAESRVARHLTTPEGVYKFDSERCETVTLDDLGVAVHGRSYRHAATTEDLAASYCRPNAMGFNLAVLHTALDGAPGHDNYAPCSLDALRAAGHDYWALGHVHERAIRSDHPFVVFPGNTQARNIRETGAKGAMVVKVRDGVVRAVEHRACDELRFANLEVDGGSARDMPTLMTAVGEALARGHAEAGGRPLATRLTIRARGPVRRAVLADTDWFEAEVGAQASALSDALWIQKVRLAAQGDEVHGGLLPDLADLLRGATGDADCARLVCESLAPLLAKLPAGVGDPEVSPLLFAARQGDGAALVAAARDFLEARFIEPVGAGFGEADDR